MLRIEHQGRPRRALLRVPAAGGPRTLLLGLHGGGATAGTAFKGLGFRELADRDGFLWLCPQGTARPAGGFTWNGGPVMDNAAVRAGIDDVGFLRALVEHVADLVPVDRKRVFATGFSAGAMMCHRLGAEAPDLVAGIAAVAGPLCIDEDQGGLPVRVMHVHGSDDPEVWFAGGSRGGRAFPSVRFTVDYWVRRNLCDLRPRVERLGEEVLVERYLPAAASGAEVVLVVVEGGGHTWPGRRWPWYDAARDGALCMSVDATGLINRVLIPERFSHFDPRDDRV